MTKPFISMYEGHDVSITVWDPNDPTNIIIYEFERISGEKHHAMSGTISYPNYQYKSMSQMGRAGTTMLVRKVLQNLEMNFGIKNDFQCFHFMPTALQDMNSVFQFDHTIINANVMRISTINHHEAHCWNAYFQCPWSKTSVLSWDAGGWNTFFMYADIDDGYMSRREEHTVYRYSMIWQLLPAHFETVRNTKNWLDVAGKVMGLSAYGKQFAEEAEAHIPKIIEWAETHQDKNLLRRKIAAECVDENGNNKRFFDPVEELTWAYALQIATERGIVDIIEREFIDRIRANDNRLCISGGTAMNILANEAIKKAYPDIEVFVPCNPGDDNLSVGLLAREIPFQPELYRVVTQGLLDCKYAGPPVFDNYKLKEFIEARNAKQVFLGEVSDMLRGGKILGFVQGRMEIGPRALGHRSILCDPSIPGMKDTINAKVKNREHFRPFAPMCRLEDADKYFDSRNYEFMDAMQFAIDVKPEWRDHLTEITHEDGTARLQTVTRESDAVMYELLTHFDGVLLNTSFNVQGKPILNMIQDALWILDNTELDHVVIRDEEGKFWLF